MSPDNRFKFDVDTQRVLRSAGWTEDRFVSADKWIRELTQRGAITFPLANRILENLGGLEIHPPHDPRELFMPSEILLNPSCVASEFDRVDLWQNEYSLTLFPLASRIELGLWNDTARTFTIFICSHCGKPTFFEGDRPLPGVAPGNSVIHLPVDVEALYTEARNCVAASCYTAAVLVCRKLLMNIAVAQGATAGETFGKYVQYLAAQGYVPPNGRGWVDHIRKKGNEANHEIALMSKTDAEELVLFIEMLLKFMYEFPNKIPAQNP